MRTSVKRQPRRQATAIEKTLSAPIGGWNARDALASMRPNDAVVLDNWFPRSSYVEIRGGYAPFAENLPANIRTLAPVNLQTGVTPLLVFYDTGVGFATFEGDYAGSVPQFQGTRTEGRHQWVQFGDGTNTWLIAVNGVDKPFYYQGNTGTYVLVDGVSSPAITGITTTDIISVGVFKNRLFFIRKNKLGFDYLPAGVAGGAASYFDLSPFATLGGYLMAVVAWTRDAGDGPDDYAVFITSEGEALVYSGTDPSSASTWGIVGTFRIGRPLGRKCFTKYGADPLILTENGLFPLSALLASGDERAKFAVSFKIQDAFSQAAKLYFDNVGWQVVSYPRQDAIIVNIPISAGRYDQYVMNTITKAWCRFTGMDAEEFAIHKLNTAQGPGELIMAKGRQIYKAWSGTSDNGQPIVCEAIQAYQDFGIARSKRPLMFMPLLESESLDSYSVGIDTDFKNYGHGASSSVQDLGDDVWDDGEWDEANWSESSLIVRQWGGVAAWTGRWLAGKMRISSSTTSARWIGSIIRFMTGGGL